MRRSFGKFYEEMTSTTSVAGAGDDKIVPVFLGKKKKKKKKPDIVKRYIENRKRSKQWNLLQINY